MNDEASNSSFTSCIKCFAFCVNSPASESSYSSRRGSSRLSRDYSSSTYSRSSIDDTDRTSRRYSRGLGEEDTTTRYSSRIRDTDVGLEDRISTRRSRTSIDTSDDRPSSRRSDSIEDRYSTRSSIRDRSSLDVGDEAIGSTRYSSRSTIRSRTSIDESHEKSRLEEIEEKYASSRYRSSSGLELEESSISRVGRKSAVEAIEEKYGLKDKSPTLLSRTSSQESSRSTSSRKKFSVEAVEEEASTSKYDSKRYSRRDESIEEGSGTLSKASKIEDKKVSALERARSYLDEMQEEEQNKASSQTTTKTETQVKEEETSVVKMEEETVSSATKEESSSVTEIKPGVNEGQATVEDVGSQEKITEKKEEKQEDEGKKDDKKELPSIPSPLVVQEITSPTTPSADSVVIHDKYTIEEVEDKEITTEETTTSPGRRGLIIRELSEMSAIEEKSVSSAATSRQLSKEMPQSPVPDKQREQDAKSPLTPILDKMAKVRQRDESQTSRTSGGEGDGSDSEGRPRTPSFHWFKDGVEFDAAERFQCQFDNEEDSLALVFQRVTPDDAGLYTCIAQTSNGKISCSAELTVQGDVRRLLKTPEAPEVKFQMGDVSAGEGTSAMIEAKISGFPKPLMTWFHDDEEVHADERHKFLENEEDETFALIIKNVQPEDSGEYTLRAKNELGEVTTKAKMTVTSAPKFTKQLSNKTVAAGDDFTLEIQFEGYPIPSVKWLKDGVEIKEEAKRIRIVTESSSESVKKTSSKTSKSKITIEKSTTSDSGNYSAVISNSCGQQSSFASVGVKALPRFDTAMNSVDVKEGETAEFTIKVSGSPTPTVSFLKDGQPLVADGNHIKITDDGNGQYRLTISNCSASDVGSYSCSATNDGGCQESSGSLKIKSKPSFSRSLNDSEAKVGDQDIDFTVIINSSPESQVKWFLNGKQISKDNKDKFEIISDGNKHTLRIKEVSMAHSGNYSCSAENSEGKSETSAKFTVTSKAKITKKLQDISLSELGTSISLSVTVEGSPKPDVKWTKDGTTVTESERIQIKEESSGISVSYTLYIKESSASDVGLWEFTASNVFGSDSSQSRVSHDKGSKPCFKKGLSSVSALHQEQDIQFSVQLQEPEEASAAAKTNVRWFIDDIEIVEVDTRYEMSAEEASQTYKLVVKTADEGTAGTYKCKASNDKGEAETSAELTVSSKPEFMQGLEDRDSLEGESITMDIVINGNPPPEIKWSKDGKKLESGGNITIEKESDMVHLLTIDNVSKETTGVYECVISNRVGEAKSSGRLSLLTKPVFIKDLDETSDGIIGEDGYIEVVVDANPRPSVCWYKNGEQISTTLLKENLENRFRLKFEPVEKDNDAQYYCEARNKVGSAKSKTCKFVAKEAKKQESKPRFTSNLSDKVVDAGAPLVLKCIIDGSPKPSIGDIKWFKDGNEVVPDGNRIKMDYDEASGLCTLTINNATANDLGNYRCLVQNSVGKNDSSCRVTGGEGFDKPKFIQGLTDGTAVHDETDIELKVELDKRYSCDKIKWFLDDIEIIEADARFKIISESSYVYRLIIKKADEFRTVGTYKCIASNSFGSTETSCRFSVNSAPKIVEQLKDKEAEPGADISLRVRVTGSPRPQIKWFKDGKEIFGDDRRIRISTDELSSSYSLVIHDVTESDLGSYSCEAFNVVGKDSSSCRVTGGAGFLKPIFKRGLKDMTVNQDDKDIQLVVETGPARDGIRNEIKWIYNDIEILPDDDRFRFIHDDNQGIYKLIIKNADKNSIGNFKCVASNQHGKNRTSGRVSMKRTTDFEVHIPERKPIEREPFNFTSDSQ